MNGARRLLLVNSHGADEFSGGTEAYVARLCDGFAARGFEVEVLAAFPSRARGRRVTTLHATDWRTDPVRRVRLHAGAVISAPTRRLDDVVARAAPDLIHTNNLPGISTAIWEVGRRRDVPVVHTIHDYHLVCPRATLLRPDGTPCRPHPLLCGLRTRRLARWASAVSHVIGVSRYILARHAYLFPHASLETIRHPAAQQPQRSLSPPGGRLKTIGYLGALESSKGVDRLLAAAPALARLGCTLRIAGDGRLRGEVEAAADRFANVGYEGVASAGSKEDFLEACDAGIAPSVWPEPGAPPLVVLEWLAAGRPVLASTRGGLAEALPELPGAIPIEPTSDGVVRTVELLVSPKKWREAVGRIRPIHEHGGIDDWLAAHERVYLTALEGRS